MCSLRHCTNAGADVQVYSEIISFPPKVKVVDAVIARMMMMMSLSTSKSHLGLGQGHSNQWMTSLPAS